MKRAYPLSLGHIALAEFYASDSASAAKGKNRWMDRFHGLNAGRDWDSAIPAGFSYPLRGSLFTQQHVIDNRNCIVDLCLLIDGQTCIPQGWAIDRKGGDRDDDLSLRQCN